MPNELPKVYVCMPAFNAAAWIEAAMESIYLQTYEGEVALIVVDDASTDKTLQAFFRAQGPHTFLIKHKRNLGPGPAHSTAFRFALGMAATHKEHSVIAIQAADDISKPERLRKSVDKLLSDHNLGVVSCNLVWFGDRSGQSPARQYASPTPGIVAWDWVYRRVGVHRNHLSHDTLWCKMVGDHEIGWGCIHENLYLYRRHPLQHSTTKLEGLKQAQKAVKETPQ